MSVVLPVPAYPPRVRHWSLPHGPRSRQSRIAARAASWSELSSSSSVVNVYLVKGLIAFVQAQGARVVVLRRLFRSAAFWAGLPGHDGLEGPGSASDLG